MTIVVRPFEKHIYRGSARPMVTISGTIRERRLVVTTMGKSIAIETEDAGQDAAGPYAVVKEGEHRLDAHARLTIDKEFDEVLSGGEIGVEFDANLLVGFSVYFDGGGYVNGSSSAHPGNPATPALVH